MQVGIFSAEENRKTKTPKKLKNRKSKKKYQKRKRKKDVSFFLFYSSRDWMRYQMDFYFPFCVSTFVENKILRFLSKFEFLIFMILFHIAKNRINNLTNIKKCEIKNVV